MKETTETNAAALDQIRFSIDVACWGARWQVHITGDLDAAGAAAMIDVVEVLATRRAPAVDLDLSEVSEIDTLGWRAVAYAQDLLSASGASSRLISPPPPLAHPARRRRSGTGTGDGNTEADPTIRPIPTAA